MRLSCILCRGKRTYRDKLEFLTKRHWRLRGSLMEVDRLRVPQRLLRDPSNPLSTAEDMFTSTRYEDSLAEEIELGVTAKEAGLLEQERLRRLSLWSPYRDDPRYHPEAEPTLIFSSKRRFTKGLDQASLLTNTAVLQNSPPALSRLTELLSSALDPTGATSNDDHRELLKRRLRGSVERAIMHAHVWHTNETRLPQRFTPELPIWKHKREFGIHPQQITRFMFHDLFKILDYQLPILASHLDLPFSIDQCSSGLPDRWITRDRFLETFYFWGPSSRRIAFAESHDLVINGKHPCQLHAADRQSILELCRFHPPPVKSLGPMSPLIDLTSTKYYRLDSTDGWNDKQDQRYPHPHLLTINLSLPNMWSDYLEPEAEPVIPEQRQAAALMHCFAATVAHARSMGIDCGELPVPIAVEGICSDGVYFDFITFQLNTLDVPEPGSDPHSTDQVRNLAWIDGHHRLFDKQVPKRSMLRNTKYRDLDMGVFTRLMSSYLWGLVGEQMGQILDTSTESNERPAPEVLAN